MLTSIFMRNVRLFRGDWRFDLKPLTVICGSNSAGKSTLLKIPLLFQQSELDPPIDSPVDGVLRLAGSRVDLGTYRTFVSDQNEDLEIMIGLEIEEKMATRRLAVLKGASPSRTRPAKRVRFAPYRLQALLEFRKGGQAQEPRAGRRPARRVGALSSAQFTVSSGGTNLLAWEVKRVAGKTDGADTLDEFAFYLPTKYERRITIKGSTLAGRQEGNRTRYGAHLYGILPSILVGQRARAAGQSDDGQRQFHIPLPPHVQEATSDLRLGLENVRYLAPLRAPAQRYYTAGIENVPPFDAAGQFLPYVLRDHLGTRVSYLPPGASGKPRSGTLRAACNLWLHYLRTGSLDVPDSAPELSISAFRDVLVEIRLRSSSSSQLHALVDSGFGYSQVLPVIATCLLSEPGSTILIEQPELHLNPALQVRLAEFFVAVMRSGRQVILETHSEHIVNAIRVLVAEDLDDDLAKKVAITFLADRGGMPTKVDLSVQPDGTVSDWPVEFFGEALELTGRLLAAQSRFRRAR